MNAMLDSFMDRALGTLMLRKKKITINVKIEYEEDVPDHELKYVFDDMHIIHERGIKEYFFDDKSEIVPNGQERLTLKAWKGCIAYDMFERESAH